MEKKKFVNLRGLMDGSLMDWSSGDEYISSLSGIREMSADWDTEQRICSLCQLRIPPNSSGWHGVCECVSPDDYDPVREPH